MDMPTGVFQVFSMEAVPMEHRGLANSSYQAAFQVPWALTAPLGGLVIAHYSYLAAFIGAAVCYLLAISILWGNFGHGKEKQFEHAVEAGTIQTIPTIDSSSHYEEYPPDTIAPILYTDLGHES